MKRFMIALTAVAMTALCAAAWGRYHYGCTIGKTTPTQAQKILIKQGFNWLICEETEQLIIRNVKFEGIRLQRAEFNFQRGRLFAVDYFYIGDCKTVYRRIVHLYTRKHGKPVIQRNYPDYQSSIWKSEGIRITVSWSDNELVVSVQLESTIPKTD